MKLKNMFAKRENEEEPYSEEASLAVEENLEQEENAEGDDKLLAAAKETVQGLIQLKNNGKLKYEPESYVRSPEFRELLGEFDVKSAARIFEAEEEVKNAYERGKSETVGDIYKRHEMPKPMRSGIGATVETDFSKMSAEEFNRLKNKLMHSK